VHSLQYNRAKVRNNCWAQAVFLEGTDDEPKLVQYACHVQFWVRVQHPANPERVLRLAITRAFVLDPIPDMPEHYTVGRGIPLPKPSKQQQQLAHQQLPAQQEEPTQQQEPEQQQPSASNATAATVSEAATEQQVGTSQARRSGRKVSKRAVPATQEAKAPRESCVGRRKSTLLEGAGRMSWYAVNGEQFHSLFVAFFPHEEGQGDMYFVPYSSHS
ncbi:hypothetical protein, partial [Bosea sp. (in: a-proteobacteria)]|uniref:hypothetical protein n=1 Tax=Bosea sp. (in: a-proteobacteria) TaxID=1871050 RepID=UPI004034D462